MPFFEKNSNRVQNGTNEALLWPKIDTFEVFLICSLAFPEIVPNDRYMKVGKSDRLGFLRTLYKFKKWRKSVVFSSKIGMG